MASLFKKLSKKIEHMFGTARGPVSDPKTKEGTKAEPAEKEKKCT